MRLRRYRKAATRGDGRAGMWEECEASDFVAFWSDTKYVMARDAEGAEWLLESGLSLLKIEEEADGLARIGRDCLVRVEAIEAVRNRANHEETGTERVFVVGGHAYKSSRRGRVGWPVGEYRQGCLKVA